jgi:hypothetical protein
MVGGWYRVDIDQYLSIIALDTLYYNKDNDMSNQLEEY